MGFAQTRSICSLSGLCPSENPPQGAREQETCHPEFISGSHDSDDNAIAGHLSSQARTARNDEEKPFNPSTVKPLNHPSPKKSAFTLAEVLITLGIIGVVAAMTLPNLVGNYQKKVTATKIKKIYTELNLAIKMSEVHNGEMKYWACDNSTSIENTASFVKKYLSPYYTSFRECAEGKDDKCGYAVSVSGITYRVKDVTYSIIVHCADPSKIDAFYVLVDLNGNKNPNVLGKDAFYFNTLTGKLMPSGWVDGLTREQALTGYDVEGTRFSCKKVKTNEDDIYTDYRHGCTALLMLDGWEFKDDYPW